MDYSLKRESKRKIQQERTELAGFTSSVMDVLKQLEASSDRVFYVIGSLQQVQKLVSLMELSGVIEIEPESISSSLEGGDLYSRSSDSARILVVDPESLLDELAGGLKERLLEVGMSLREEGGWLFLLSNEVKGDSASGAETIDKALNLKTKGVSKVSKKVPAGVLDLRKVIFSNTPAGKSSYYSMFPYTSEFVGDEEVEEAWGWADTSSKVVELFSRLFSIEGVQSWGRLSSQDEFRLVTACEYYEKAWQGSTASKASIIMVKMYPFLRRIIDIGHKHYEGHLSYVLVMFASWVYLSTTRWAEDGYPGLESRLSGRGRRYLTFTPSSAALTNWVSMLGRL